MGLPAGSPVPTPDVIVASDWMTNYAYHQRQKLARTAGGIQSQDQPARRHGGLSPKLFTAFRAVPDLNL